MRGITFSPLGSWRPLHTATQVATRSILKYNSSNHSIKSICQFPNLTRQDSVLYCNLREGSKIFISTQIRIHTYSYIHTNLTYRYSKSKLSGTKKLIGQQTTTNKSTKRWLNNTHSALSSDSYKSWHCSEWNADVPSSPLYPIKVHKHKMLC